MKVGGENRRQHTALLKGISPELRKRMQGKSCFKTSPMSY
jgi:hypothetical protein